jgi:hypothetical protein
MVHILIHTGYSVSVRSNTWKSRLQKQSFILRIIQKGSRHRINTIIFIEKLIQSCTYFNTLKTLEQSVLSQSLPY